MPMVSTFERKLCKNKAIKHMLQRKGDQKIGKIAKNLGKVAKTVAQLKIYMSKLNLKVRSIYIKPILKPKILEKTHFKTTNF
jgi:hypothetical protein